MNIDMFVMSTGEVIQETEVPTAVNRIDRIQ